MRVLSRTERKVRRHRMLFDTTLPFRARVEADRTRYTRKIKHKKLDI